MSEITFNILALVVSVSCALIAAYILPYLRNKLNDEKYGQLLEMINIAVRAAEQIYKESGMGKIKKEQVVAIVTGWMNEHGISISVQQLDQLIEAAVYELNKG
jgi:LL-H family phage holin